MAKKTPTGGAVADAEKEKKRATKEAEEATKKKVPVKKNGVEKEKKLGKVCIEFSLLEPLLKSGEPIKVKDILTKIKVEKTKCSPYFRIYSTLKKASKQGLVKNLGKGTFQLTSSNRKATSKETEPKEEPPL